MLLTGKAKNKITIQTPKGIAYTADITDIWNSAGSFLPRMTLYGLDTFCPQAPPDGSKRVQSFPICGTIRSVTCCQTVSRAARSSASVTGATIARFVVNIIPPSSTPKIHSADIKTADQIGRAHV